MASEVTALARARGNISLRRGSLRLGRCDTADGEIIASLLYEVGGMLPEVTSAWAGAALTGFTRLFELKLLASKAEWHALLVAVVLVDCTRAVRLVCMYSSIVQAEIVPKSGKKRQTRVDLYGG